MNFTKTRVIFKKLKYEIRNKYFLLLQQFKNFIKIYSNTTKFPKTSAIFKKLKYEIRNICFLLLQQFKNFIESTSKESLAQKIDSINKTYCFIARFLMLQSRVANFQNNSLVYIHIS